MHVCMYAYAYSTKANRHTYTVMMSGATIGIAVMPTYYDIGVFATVLLSVMRLLQGLSVGGEFVGSLVFAIESSPPKYRVFAGSICTASATCGVSLGSWTGLLLNSVFSQEEMRQFGWRIPFFAGIFIGLFAYWARVNLEDTCDSAHTAAAETQGGGGGGGGFGEGGGGGGEVQANATHTNNSETQLPLWVALREHPKPIIVATVSTACYSFAVWFLTTFPPTLYGTLMDPPLGGGGARMWYDSQKSALFMIFYRKDPRALIFEKIPQASALALLLLHFWVLPNLGLGWGWCRRSSYDEGW
jgi:MFS family permease